MVLSTDDIYVKKKVIVVVHCCRKNNNKVYHLSHIEITMVQLLTAGLHQEVRSTERRLAVIDCDRTLRSY